MNALLDEANTRRAKEWLEDRGYIVLKKKSHEHTLRELHRAKAEVVFNESLIDSQRHYQETLHDDSRRLSERLNAVCVAAAAPGVDIVTINQALAAGDQRVEKNKALVLEHLSRFLR